jgi:putative endonuclease
MAARPKRFVYLLRSVADPTRWYVGVTADVEARLRAHDAGQSPSTAPYRPWEAVVQIAFQSESAALRFERYLKSGSGQAFAKRHFR